MLFILSNYHSRSNHLQNHAIMLPWDLLQLLKLIPDHEFVLDRIRQMNFWGVTWIESNECNAGETMTNMQVTLRSQSIQCIESHRSSNSKCQATFRMHQDVTIELPENLIDVPPHELGEMVNNIVPSSPNRCHSMNPIVPNISSILRSAVKHANRKVTRKNSEASERGNKKKSYHFKSDPSSSY